MRVIVQPQSGTMQVDFHKLDGTNLRYQIQNECTKHSMSFAQKGCLDSVQTLQPLECTMWVYRVCLCLAMHTINWLVPLFALNASAWYV